jgi:hypothetical protein
MYRILSLVGSNPARADPTVISQTVKQQTKFKNRLAEPERERMRISIKLVSPEQIPGCALWAALSCKLAADKIPNYPSLANFSP